MPGTFWESWQLWEKMCFVLGSSIVIVVMLGCLKLVFNNWRLRKYTAIAATKAVVRQEMRHTVSVRRARSNKIPFGIRALESGIEVDGVWISGTNTPRDSLSHSPTIPPKLENSKRTEVPRLEIPQAAPGYIVGNSNAIAPEAKKARVGQIDHPMAQGNATTERSTYRPPSVFAEQNPRERDVYQPRRSSGLRYFSDSGTPHRAESMVMQNKQPQVQKPTRQRSIDLGTEEGQESHRRSFSWAGSTSSEEQSVKGRFDQKDFPPRDPFQGSQRAVSPVSSDDSNPFLTPTRASIEPTGDTLHFDGGHEIAANLRTPRNDHIDFDQGHAPPIRPFEADRQTQVIRKINSGFEILRPGTLDQPRQSTDTTALREMSDSGNKRRSKKLQRKRRSSGMAYPVGTSSVHGSPQDGRP